MAERTTEIAVVGAGAVGLAAALAFAHEGFATTLIGPRVIRADGRTAALLQPSLALLGRLGLTAELTRLSAPLAAMRIVDDTGSLFRPPPVTFRASEIGLEAFGRNIENAALVGLLSEAVDGRSDALSWRETTATGIDEDGSHLALATGETLRAKLVVAADGRGSPLRAAAGIHARSWSYPQSAFTTILRHEREHEEVSTEFHTRGGPFTLVPLPGRRSSLVWVTTPAHAAQLLSGSDADLATAIEARARRLLGAVTIDGPRGSVPLGALAADTLASGRWALVGEAAHALPPIGAQGLNMGLKDVAILVEETRSARFAKRGIGAAASLAAYERRRMGDIRMRMAAVDGLNRSLLTDLGGVDALRGLGLGALARLGPLRRAVMRAGLMAGVTASKRGA